MRQSMGTRQRALTPVAAAAHGDRLRQQRVEKGIPAKERRRMPDTGFFAEADPNAELRNPGGFVENIDFSKRGGRYQSDFIWNLDWQTQLDKEDSLERARKRVREAPTPDAEGGLGLARRLNLDSMDVDLSSVLNKPKPDPFAAFRNGDGSAGVRRRESAKPTQADSRRWDRSGKFATRAAAPTLNEDEVALQQSEIDAYNQLKQDLQLWTLTFSAIGLSCTWALTSKEGAISYGIGAIGSLLYLRMLNRSMDSVGGGSIGGALGQPRLLIPIVLAMGYHRWNHLKAEEVGLTLQLLPMLLGFFTYKAAVLGKQGTVLLSELSQSFQPNKIEPQA